MTTTPQTPRRSSRKAATPDDDSLAVTPSRSPAKKKHVSEKSDGSLLITPEEKHAKPASPRKHKAPSKQQSLKEDEKPPEQASTRRSPRLLNSAPPPQPKITAATTNIKNKQSNPSDKRKKSEIATKASKPKDKSSTRKDATKPKYKSSSGDESRIKTVGNKADKQLLEEEEEVVAEVVDVDVAEVARQINHRKHPNPRRRTIHRRRRRKKERKIPSQRTRTIPISPYNRNRSQFYPSHNLRVNRPDRDQKQ